MYGTAEPLECSTHTSSEETASGSMRTRTRGQSTENRASSAHPISLDDEYGTASPEILILLFITLRQIIQLPLALQNTTFSSKVNTQQDFGNFPAKYKHVLYGGSSEPSDTLFPGFKTK